jgi:beta-mannosidase
MSLATSRALQEWHFTQVGGGAGTKNGEWLQVDSFPTTVHVELIKLKRIPDPVRPSHSFELSTSEYALTVHRSP